MAWLACAFAALGSFAWLAAEVAYGRTLAFDLWLRALVHGWATPALTTVMLSITLLGTPGLLFPVGIAALWWMIARGFRHAARLFAICVTGGFVLDMTLKLLFHRARPEPFFGYPLPHSYSFPSGHAIFSVCFYGVLAVLAARGARPRAAKILVLAGAVVWAVLIGLTRIYFGVHYPTDVLGGYAAAAAWVASVFAVDTWRGQRKNSRIRPGEPVV